MLRWPTEKLKLLQELCTEAGVHTTPQCVDNVWIVPLYSWYHASFDKEPDIPGALPAHKASSLTDDAAVAH